MAYLVYPIQITTGQKLNFIGNDVSGAAPTTSLLTVPVSIQTFGGLGNLMGLPNGWISVLISGMDYKIPYYQ